MLTIQQLTPEHFKTWNDFCLQNNQSWFWHTADWLEYSNNYKPNSKQMSFMVLNNNKTIAVMPLILTDDILNGDIPAVSDSKYINQEHVLKIIFNHIDKLAKELDVKCCSLKFSPLVTDYFKEPIYNYLQRYGFIDTSINTQVIDLTKNTEQLLNDSRRSHRYDMNRGNTAYKIKIFDKHNITKEIFEQYRLFHHKCSGKVTRPFITFWQMYHWILDGNAILCSCSTFKDEFIAFDLVITYKNGAYYASESDNPNVKTNVPFGHIMQWKIIEWLKEHNYQYYEIGWQQFNTQWHDFPTEKDKSISFYKRGFGGYTVPLFKGEKYYSKEYFIKTQTKRLTKFINTYNEV